MVRGTLSKKLGGKSDLATFFPNMSRIEGSSQGVAEEYRCLRGWKGCLEDGRFVRRRGFFWDRRRAISEARVDNAEVRVMDRLPLPSDRIDETLIRVEWPDPTGKYRPSGCAP